MGSQRIILLVAFVLIEGYNVAAQCGRVEYLTQPAAPPLIQPISQFVVPAIIKPLIEPEKPAQPSKPAMPDYSQFPMYPPMPYIIYKDDDDDEWRNLLLILLAMKSKGSFGSNVPQTIPYPYPVPMDFGYPDRFGYGNNMNYIPCPNGGFVDPNVGYENEITIVPSVVQGQPGRENEVTLFIRTEK